MGEEMPFWAIICMAAGVALTSLSRRYRHPLVADTFEAAGTVTIFVGIVLLIRGG